MSVICVYLFFRTIYLKSVLSEIFRPWDTVLYSASYPDRNILQIQIYALTPGSI